MNLSLLAGGALLGALAGVVMTWLVAQQARRDGDPRPAPRRALAWVPLIGAATQRHWFDLAVEITTIVVTAGLLAQRGLSLNFLTIWLAALVLIDTGAVDWQIKLIDVLVLLGATVAITAGAPLHGLPWLRALQGLGTGLAIFLLLFFTAKLMYPGQAAPFGLGDVYLGTFIGALVGFFDLPVALFYGVLLAGVVSIGLLVTQGFRRARYLTISYGTYLCLGTLFYLLVFAHN